MADFWATTGSRALGPSATSGWMSIRTLFLRMVVNEERPRFGALLSMALTEFGCRRAGVNRSPGPSCPHPTLVDDAASFPQNRPPTTTATDDTSFGNGFGATILLVCAARNHRVFLPLPTTASGTSNRSTASAVIQILLPAFDPRNTVGERVPVPFALVSNTLAHSRKSAVILGESGSTVPANIDPHLSSPGFFQSSHRS